MQLQPQQDKTTHYLCSLTPLFDENQKTTGAFAMVADISEIKEVETALKKSQVTLTATFESTGDGILVMDENQIVTHANDRFLQIWKLPSNYIEEIQGAQFLDHLLSKLAQPELFRGQVKRLMNSSDQALETISLIDGRLLECYSGPLFSEEIETGRIWIFKDVTKKKQLESQLLQAQKMEAIGNLAGGIAHDFNNRLQTVSGYTQLLLLRKDRDEAETNKLKAIENAVKKSCELTRQLLTFSRKIESELRPIDLNHEVKTIVKLLKRTIPRKISIELHLKPELDTINADASQIEQVIMNLGINASHAMPDGGRLVIETDNVYLDDFYCKSHVGVKPGSYVRLYISDTGAGMNPETLSRIFEPFFTTKHDTQGTGLGLAMVHGIVKNHGGHIICYSQPDQGSSFKIHLPVLEDNIALTTPDGSPPIILPRGFETILMVDDEIEIITVGKSILEEFGYRVITATSGPSAIEIYSQKKNEIDMVILDLNMPNMNGREVLRALLKQDPALKIMISSGYSANGSVKEVMTAGAAGFVGKPYQLEELLVRIRQILDK